jgi:RNA polymerase primary sigma factor
MRTTRHDSDADGLGTLDRADTEVLGARKERELLRDLADCKRKLAEALAATPGIELPEGVTQPQALSQFIAQARLQVHDARAEAVLGAVFRRYFELRGTLAMANLRLVAHVAKRFRDRGVAYSDLLQEGFCGLLEAIDRFDLAHETKLATYATWWIRQAMQRAVAAGAYPVRLSPRHLRQLAQNQDELGSQGGPGPVGRDQSAASGELIRHIHTATRPTVSLDATIDRDGQFRLIQTMSDPEGDRTGEVETGETIDKLLGVLRPREQRVLSLRFGLGGGARMSLSQVGKVLDVSKERVRQIQDRALERLRAVAAEDDLADLLMTGD